MAQAARVIEATFDRTVVSPDATEFAAMPAVAFAGRSNVGKSSLLNALCGRKSLATTSKTPGRTRALNFFQVRLREETEQPEADVEGYFVDIPGYGYAQVSRSEQKKWAQLIEGYLLEDPWLRAIVVLIDSRRGVQEEELQLVHFVREDIETIPVLTKCDKLSKSELAKAKKTAASKLGISAEEIFTTSSSKKVGVGKLIGRIYKVLASEVQ